MQLFLVNKKVAAVYNSFDSQQHHHHKFVIRSHICSSFNFFWVVPLDFSKKKSIKWVFHTWGSFFSNPILSFLNNEDHLIHFLQLVFQQ